jgi:hypothetical protein
MASPRAWLHESQVGGIDIDHPTGVLQALSRIPFGGGGDDTTQRFTYYHDFSESTSYRSEAEITAPAAMNARLALKFGYLWRFANASAPGFKKIDQYDDGVRGAALEGVDAGRALAALFRYPQHRSQLPATGSTRVAPIAEARLSPAPAAAVTTNASIGGFAPLAR